MDFKINDSLRGFNLTFKTTYDLFSYRKIDEGTKLLINAIQIPDGAISLDLGCGYGPVGIVMAKLNEKGKTYLVDRDFVAVEYAKKNCVINNVKNCECLLSNGFSHLGNRQFDIIASNLPTHIAKESLEAIIADAFSHLAENGFFYVVCFNRLDSFIKKMLSSRFSKVEKAASNNSYSVLLSTKS